MDNNFDEIDKLFVDYFEQNKEVPDVVSNGIECALDSINRKQSIILLIKKIIITLIGLATISSGFVFANDIKNFIMHFFNYNEGMDTAIENGYIEDINMEYIESNATEVKLNNLLMDDYNLSFTMLIKFDTSIDIEKIKQVKLPNLLISDNDNKILYCEDEETFSNYCSKNYLNYEYMNFNNNYINSGSNWYIKSKSNENNEIELIYNFYGNTYPKSKTVFVDFSKINISETEDCQNMNKCIIGSWNIKIDVPEKFYNREALVYKVKSCSDENIKVTEAIVYNSCMKFQLETQEEPVYLSSDSEEVKKQKAEEWVKKHDEDVANKDFSNIHIFGYDPYVETETHQRYYPTESSSEDSGFSRPFTGDITYWQTFSLTKYDATNYLTVFIKYKQKDIKIELERIK